MMSIGEELSSLFAFLLPSKPILIKYRGVWSLHDRIARKILALSAEIQFLFFHAITGEAITRCVFIFTATATAFYVCRARAAVKATFAKQFFVHIQPLKCEGNTSPLSRYNQFMEQGKHYGCVNSYMLNISFLALYCYYIITI